MRRSRKGTFPFVYFIYLCLLFVGFVVSVMYVNSVIREYESGHPETIVLEYVETMRKSADGGELLKDADIPADFSERFESVELIKNKYRELVCSEKVKSVCTLDDAEKGIKEYTVSVDGIKLLSIEMKLVGEVKTKLAIIPVARYEITKATPLFEKQSYTLSLPSDFSVKVNGVSLSHDDGEMLGDSGIDYTISDLYMLPTFEIRDESGISTNYTIDNGKVTAELYNYTLTLPRSLSVTLDGEAHPGEAVDDERIRHDIRLLTKPDVVITDAYGNSVKYEGGNDLPLTYVTVSALDSYKINVEGGEVPAEFVTDEQIADYEVFAEFVESLPYIRKYNIAVLKDAAEIAIYDKSGEAVEFDRSAGSVDLTVPVGMDEIPAEISDRVDVLSVAESWSLFMSNDLQFYTLTQYLLPDSFQYEAAKKYNSGVDKNFMSEHTLLDPTFRDESVRNFVMITEDSFSVDISFGKYMRVAGQTQVDEMNHSFYFVKHTDGSWRLAGMKEVVNDAE